MQANLILDLFQPLVYICHSHHKIPCKRHEHPERENQPTSKKFEQFKILNWPDLIQKRADCKEKNRGVKFRVS
jgi:hypothetical protein